MRSAIRAVLAALLFAPAALAAQQPLPLDTLHVQAGSRTIAGAAALTRAVDVLDRAAIERLPVRTVSDVIARAAGVDLQPRSPAQADVSVRGGSFEQVLVLVDGVAVNDLQTGHAHLDVAVPLDAIERVEVLRGPASALYGSSAVGGVINIVTRREPALSARAQGGSFGSWSAGAEAGHRLGRTAVRLGAEHDASDGHRAGTDHRITQLRASLDSEIGGGALKASLAGAARDFGAADFYAPFESYEETRTATAVLSWASRPASLTVEPRLSWRRHGDDFILRRDDPAFYRNRHTTHVTHGELVARWQAAPAVRIALGGDVQRSSIESNSLGDRTEHAAAAFAEAAAGRADAVLVTAGARIDHHSTFGSFLSPSLAAGWRVTRALRLRASAGAGFRAPSWTDRFYEDPANIGSPDLAVERFRTAEAGAALATGPALLDATVFIRRAEDLIDWARPVGSDPSGPWRTRNVDRATFRGLELHGGLRLPLLTADLRASWLDLDAREEPGLESKYALQPLTRSVSLEVDVPVGPFGLTGRASTHRRAGGKDWMLVDTGLRASLGSVQVHAGVTNLFDEKYLDVSARPAAGRAFSAGLRVRR